MLVPKNQTYDGFIGTNMVQKSEINERKTKFN